MTILLNRCRKALLIVVMVCVPWLAQAQVVFDDYTFCAGQAPFFPAGCPHTPGAAPQAILGILIHASSYSDQITDSQYGGTNLVEVGCAVDTAGEPGKTCMYFLGSSVPTGTQPWTATDPLTFGKWAWVLSFTAGNDMEVLTSGFSNEDSANPSVTLTTTDTALLVCALWSGHGDESEVTVGSGFTRLDAVNFDVSSMVVEYQAGVAAGSPTCDFTATSDDAALFAVALRELPTGRGAVLSIGGK